MGEAFIVRRGGTANPFAAISVTYPEGSICTCTKGSKILKAKDTSGQWLFALPEDGDWIVRSSDDQKSTERIVTTAIGHSYAIELLYEQYIFNGGQIIPFSYNIQDRNGTVTIGTSITISCPYAYVRMFTSSKIDVTDYSRLTIHFTSSSRIGQWGVASTLPASDFSVGNATYVARGSQTKAGDGTVSVDISKLSGSYYLLFYDCWQATIDYIVLS